MREPWVKRLWFVFIFVLFSFKPAEVSANYSLAGRHFNYLSIDASKFNSGEPYYNLRGSVTMHWSENLFYFLMRVLDNECWSASPGNLCNYKFLGIMLDPGTWTHHDAGPLRTKPLEQCPKRSKYLGVCVDCTSEGAVGSSNYWYIPKDPTSKAGIDLYIMSNGDGYSWDGSHGGSNSIYSGLSSCNGHCSGTCSGYSCCYCSSAYEHGGGNKTEGYYCFPGDDQAIYVDINHLYFSWANAPRVLKADGTYETLRDSNHTPPYHSGYTFPGPLQSNGRSCYNYPNPSPCKNVWDGADITKFGFCTGPNNCGDYPADSIVFRIHIPDVYAELGVDAGDVLGRGGGYIKWDYFDVVAYMKVFFWDNTNDGINDPDALDMDIKVTKVDLDNNPDSAFDLNIGLGSLLSLILPLFTGTLENMFQNQLNSTLKSALAGALPINLNNLLGNPWKIGNGLLDVGLYGQNPDVVDSSYSTSTIYREVNGTYDSHGLWKPSSYTNCALDIRINAAVEPILFNANCTRDFDLNNPEPTDFFGICTLYNHNDGVDEDQQFDNDSGPNDFGPPLIAKSDTPPQYVKPPSLSSLSPIKYGVNTWGGFRTVMYDANHNGIKDDGSSNVYNYDMALSIHENFLKQALYAAFAAGIMDFKLTPYDQNGNPTPFKDFLKVDVWKSLIPVLGKLAKDNSYVEIKLVPRATPDAKVGVGTYPNSSGPGAGMTGKFDVAFFFPSLDFEFWFTDKNDVKKKIMVIRWNLATGFDLEFHKGCSPQDPYYGKIQCNPAYDYLPDYVPGYIMLYGEVNSPSLIANRGITPIQVISSEIDVNNSLLKDQFSNIIPVLMSSYIQFYLETRFRLVGLTFDMHYSGPDGPGNKWFSLYISLLGNTNIFQFLGNLSLTGATPADLNPETIVKVPGSEGSEAYLPADYVNKLVTSDDKLIFAYDGESKLVSHNQLFYTYRLDGGLWHPLTKKRVAEINLKGLLDGKHIFEVASVQSYKGYTWMDYTPAKIEFIVDKTPPEIEFLSPDRVFTNGDNIVVATKDLTDVNISWSIDGEKFSPWTSSRIIPLAGLKAGTHRLVVRAKDEAGNESEKGLVFEIKQESSFGCSSANGNDWLVIFVVMLLGLVILRKGSQKT